MWCRPSLPMEAIRYHYLNQYYTSSNSKRYQNSDVSRTSLHATAQDNRRPLIASFDHPLRKRLREIESYDLESRLGYGPHWVNKELLRSHYFVPKPSPSCGRLMNIRSSTSETPHAITRTHFSTSLHTTAQLQDDRRPLIASFDHPLRKRLREIQSYDLENLLGYGPHWVNKELLRSHYFVPKPSPSCGRLMNIRSSTSETPHAITRTHFSTSLHTTAQLQDDRRPLIASFDHPLRKRLREIQSYDLENLLGYGPHWVNKEHLRSHCFASKPSPSCGRLMNMRSSTSETSHATTRTLFESRFDDSKPLKLPKATRVIHLYNQGNTVGASSLSVSPLDRSVDRIPNYSAFCGLCSSNHRHTTFPPQHKEKIDSEETRSEEDVLDKYCRWFDKLSSAILKNHIDGPKSPGVDKMKANDDSNHQRGLQKSGYTKLDLENQQDFNHCNRDERLENEFVRRERGITPINRNKDGKDREKKDDKRKDGEDMKNGELSGTIQNNHHEKETVLKAKEKDFSSGPEHGILCESQSTEHLGENSDDLFVEKLVCIVKNYKYRKTQRGDDEHGQKDSLKQEEETTEKDHIFNKQNENRRRKTIKVPRNSVAQQENTFAKLKRTFYEAMDDEEQFYEAQVESSLFKNKICRPDCRDIMVSQIDEDR